MIEVILADDHEIVREGIKAVIESKAEDIKIVAEASDGEKVLKIASNNPSAIYILDISMPILNGIETTRKLIKKFPKSKVIILSVHDQKAFVDKALKCGAKGYILKESATEEVIRGIREVSMNRIYFSPKLAKFIVQGYLGKKAPQENYSKTQELSERETEVLQLIAEGFSNKEIAKKLNIALNTVHVHRNNLMAKLDIHRQAGLIRYALKEKITQL